MLFSSLVRRLAGDYFEYLQDIVTANNPAKCAAASIAPRMRGGK
jgi:hypothetical protein